MASHANGVGIINRAVPIVEPSDDNMYNVSSISSVAPSQKKKIKERTKSKLVARRRHVIHDSPQ